MYGASHEHHSNDDLPEHAQLALGSTQAAHYRMATAGAFAARARRVERRDLARHRHHALRCAPRTEQTILDGLEHEQQHALQGETGRQATGGPFFCAASFGSFRVSAIQIEGSKDQAQMRGHYRPGTSELCG